MKILLLALALTSPLACPLGHAEEPRTYGIHLFFNEKEFVDVLTLSRSAGGALHAHMSVPNDFEGEIDSIRESGDTLSFDLPVPKNASRPQDLVFHYEARYFDGTHAQLTGFVTIPGAREPGFVASFVGFRR